MANLEIIFVLNMSYKNSHKLYSESNCDSFLGYDVTISSQPSSTNSLLS